MISISAYSDKVKRIFSGFLESTGLNSDHTFYRRVIEIETDVKFFNDLISRFPAKSAFEFRVHLSMEGLIYGRFLKRIYEYYYSNYDFKFLPEQMYVFEVLKRLFENYWIDNIGINRETVSHIRQFHPVVKYYINVENIEDYISDFIGSSYAIGEFNKELQKQISEQNAQASVATEAQTELPNPD